MELKLMSFNIRYDGAHDVGNRWTQRKELVLDTVRREEPDVVGFQEVLPHQRWDLEEGLWRYRLVGRGREQDAGGEQCTVAFKPAMDLLKCETFWLSDSPEEPASVGWDAMLTRICTHVHLRYQGREFSVFNAHFDHHGTVAPVKSAWLLLERMEQLDHPHLLMGDFNSHPDSETLRALRTRLRDSISETVDDDGGTYHDYGRLDKPTRIDYLMMSPEWQIVDCRILAQDEGPYPSNHFPVLGSYRLP